MGMLLTLFLLIGVTTALAFTAGVWTTYRLLDGDNQYDIREWWRRRMNDVFPFSSALIYRTRYWWRHKVRGKPVPKPYDGPLPSFVKSLYALTPLDIPFLSMIGMTSEEPYTFKAPDVSMPRYTRDQGVLDRLSDMNEEMDDQHDGGYDGDNVT